MIKYRVFDIIQNKYIDNRDVSITGDGTLTSTRTLSCWRRNNMLIFWIIFVAILLIGAAITAAVAEEVEYRRDVRESKNNNLRRK